MTITPESIATDLRKAADALEKTADVTACQFTLDDIRDALEWLTEEDDDDEDDEDSEFEDEDD